MGAVKRFVCHNKDSECHCCAFALGCVYHRIFEAKGEKGHETTQNAYVIHCNDRKTAYSAGQELLFSISIFGNVADCAPYLIKGLFDAQKRGLTARHAAFKVKQISAGNNKKIYDGDVLDMSRASETLAIDSDETSQESAIVRFVTPFRTKIDGKFAKDINSAVLVRALLDRFISLDLAKREDVRAWMKEGLALFSQDLTINDKQFRWMEETRYSNRQKTTMQLGGIAGSFRLSGDSLSVLYPLLRIGEITHIGKATTFGFGKYEVEEKI